MSGVRVVRLPGLSDYAAVHELQRHLIAARAAGDAPDTILLLEHAHTITVGRARGAEANVLEAADMPVVAVERGGDVTWHGPGQLVAYPIVLLEGDRMDLHRHLRSLEDAVIEVLDQLGLAPTRDDRNTGVWLPEPAPAQPRKVCSVGIGCRRWVTWHGLALNVAPDPQVWERIRPCGFDATVMTRLADHLERSPTLDDLVEPLARALCRTLGLPWPGAIDYGSEAGPTFPYSTTTPF